MYIKYPRTYHLPWSLGTTNKDKIHTSTDMFVDREVVVTIKMDGENTTLYSDYLHARSINSGPHPSRGYITADWASKFRQFIPLGWRVCVENMYATHSIYYNDLPSYVIGLNIWNEYNVCLCWEATREWFNYLSIPLPNIIYRGIYSEPVIKKYMKERLNKDEGYVLRITDEIKYDDFSKYVGKYVRANHVTTDEHWMHQPIKTNKLAG